MKLSKTWIAVVSVAVVALSLGGWWLSSRDRVLGTSAEFRTYKSADGWTMQYPASWHLQTYDGAPPIVATRFLARGAIVSDIPSDLRRAGPRTTAWDLSHVPPGFVALDFGISEGGPQSRAFRLKLPLALSEMRKAQQRGSLVARYEGGFKLGHQYLAYAYVGSGASAVQRRAVKRMLASINFKDFQPSYVFSGERVSFDQSRGVATIHFKVAWNGAVFPGVRRCTWISHPPDASPVVLGSKRIEVDGPRGGSLQTNTTKRPRHVDVECGSRLDHGRYVVTRSGLVTKHGLWLLRYRARWRGSKVAGIGECSVMVRDKTGREADYNVRLRGGRHVRGSSKAAHLDFFRAHPSASMKCHPYRY